VDALTLQTLGNDVLKPERSVELEGGFDADLLDDRISLGVTGYRKTRIDALMNVPLPPSVYGDGLNILENVGTIRNTGYNITLGAQLVRTDLVTWRADVSVSHNKNLVVALGPGVEPFQSNDSRVVAGYPLGGRWGKPVLGYGDLNDDGVLEPNEVLYGDSLVFLGLSEPDFTGSLQTTLSFFRGTVTLSGSFLYTGGVASIGPWADLRAISRGLNDPTSSLGEQAVVLTSDVSDFLNTQTTNTLRFNSLSIAYNVSHRLAQLVGARSLSIALQGTNLGLHTNYRGLDPDVGYGYDRGTLPQPRTWQVRVSAGY
jgi:hypothetical protein